ncbi:lytic transglycosylase domain-containing protein [Oceaniglobus indicus]|uniref:lytic transglycosylase domain-containing protein n=1 Tax=Oceaniglobus indicus TaxID=2047749 RepID=UPI000C1A0E4F|nr:lytic transglycosylase domain-containing protein [Oceaniglobus indicus]
MITRRFALCNGVAFALGACGRQPPPPPPEASRGARALSPKIAFYAQKWNVPESLVHRVVQRESGYDPAARNGPYYGLMQIHPTTARTMGHKGAPDALLDADTNLNYAVKYLRGAWMVADGSPDRAVSWYSRGYYYEAKKRGLLKETGLR